MRLCRRRAVIGRWLEAAMYVPSGRLRRCAKHVQSSMPARVTAEHSAPTTGLFSEQAVTETLARHRGIRRVQLCIPREQRQSHPASSQPPA